jgi:hypothetical protein
MPSDYAFYYLTQPGGIMFLVALLFGPIVLVRLVARTSYIQVGIRRLLLAHSAVLVATVVLATLEAISIGREKLAAGHVAQEAFVNWLASGVLYLAVLMYVFTLAFASFIVLPFYVWCVSRSRGTLVSLATLGVVCAMTVASLAVAFPSNQWAQTHPVQEFVAALSSIGVGAVVVCVAFGVGARAPVFCAPIDNST